MRMRFRDRADAGRRLAAHLASYKNENPVILALPRGGVVVGAEIAAALHAPLDVILVRKIGAPIQPELALGAVVDGREAIVVRNPYVIESTATNEEEFKVLCEEQLAEIERRRALYVGQRQPLEIEGRVAIIVDDGIATGATALAALQATRIRRPRKLVLAVPIAPAELIEQLRDKADDVVCLDDMTVGAIGYYYDDSHQVSDDDVVRILARFQPAIKERTNISEHDVRRLVGDIDDAKLAEIMTLAPSQQELEEASVWAGGNGDLRARQGHPLHGKVAKLLNILTADEDEEQR
jgi:predicted phosphoribosyltransferase